MVTGLPPPDRMYNSFREGRRYRLTSINLIPEDGDPIVGMLDVFSEDMSFCHNIRFKNEIAHAHKNNMALSLETLILLKTQIIRLISKEGVSDHDFRLLKEFDDHNYILGMEPKDAIDVCSALYDYEIEGMPKVSIDIDRIQQVLISDWGLYRTVMLNLQNLLNKLELLLEEKGATQDQVSQVKDRLAIFIKKLEEIKPLTRKPITKFRKKWWNTVED